MFPYIKIFGKVITSYTLMAIVGMLVAGIFCVKRSKQVKIDDNDIIVFLLICSIGALIGGHLLYGITNMNWLIKFISNFHKVTSINIFIDCILEIFGGSVFYGGLIGGLIAGFIYAKLKKININLYSYIVVPAIPLFHTFGRLGCFLSGCCYGIESKIGFVYQNALISLANGYRRFPVQLLEAFCNLLIFLLLYFLQKKKKCYGYLLEIYLLIYSFIRFFLEYLRGDSYRGFIFNLSTSQFISILIFAFAIISILFKRIKVNTNISAK